MTPFHFASDSEPKSGRRRILVPAQLETKAELLAFLAHAIPLPDYFGHNWDALEECLLDPDLLKDEKIALVHRDVPLENAPIEQRIYLQILAQAARESDRISVFFPETCRELIGPSGRR